MHCDNLKSVFVKEYKSDPVARTAVNFISKLVTATFNVDVGIVVVISIIAVGFIIAVSFLITLASSTVSQFLGVTI